MSRSPHRLRGDAAEAWSLLLFGEALRALENVGARTFVVQSGETVKLPRSGRWQTGLSVLRPALDDDILGHTALAVAWRWACAELEANAWPSIGLVAGQAVRGRIVEEPLMSLGRAGEVVLGVGPGVGRLWTLELDTPATFRIEGASGVDFTELDRVADIAAAWFDAEWMSASRE